MIGGIFVLGHFLYFIFLRLIILYLLIPNGRFNDYFTHVFLFCVLINKTTKIKLKYYEAGITQKIIMNIFGGYKLIRIGTGGEGEEYQYWYPDSSMIYLSDASGLRSVNDQSVRNQEVDRRNTLIVCY